MNGIACRPQVTRVGIRVVVVPRPGLPCYNHVHVWQSWAVHTQYHCDLHAMHAPQSSHTNGTRLGGHDNHYFECEYACMCIYLESCFGPCLVEYRPSSAPFSLVRILEAPSSSWEAFDSDSLFASVRASFYLSPKFSGI